jgi:hypothetical protein
LPSITSVDGPTLAKYTCDALAGEAVKFAAVNYAVSVCVNPDGKGTPRGIMAVDLEITVGIEFGQL